MPNDPALSADRCTFMEAITGDNGVHSSGGTWWLSPDVIIVGANPLDTRVTAGQNTTIRVELHRKGSCELPSGTGGWLVDVYVGDPSTAMIPVPDGAQVKKLGSIPIDISEIPASGGSITQDLSWTPGSSGTAPDGAGHKCLVARGYADSLSPSNGNFFLPDDQHVVQHNLVIQAVEKASGSGSGFFRLPVLIANPDREKPQRVTVRTSLVRELSPRIIKSLDLRQLPPLHQPISNIPEKFHLHFGDVQILKVRDYSRLNKAGSLYGRRNVPNIEWLINLKPGEISKTMFEVDYSNVKSGTAQAFNIIQVGADNQVQGGITVILVVKG